MNYTVYASGYVWDSYKFRKELLGEKVHSYITQKTPITNHENQRTKQFGYNIMRGGFVTTPIITSTVIQRKNFNLEWYSNTYVKGTLSRASNFVYVSPITFRTSKISIKSLSKRSDISSYLPSSSQKLYVTHREKITLSFQTSSERVIKRPYGGYMSFITNYAVTQVIRADKTADKQTPYKATVIVKGLMPNYYSMNICDSGQNKLEEIVIPVRVGEFYRFFESKKRITDVYNKPFGVKFNDKSIYGRLITLDEVTMIVKFEDSSVIKLTLKPYITDFISTSFGG